MTLHDAVECAVRDRLKEVGVRKYSKSIEKLADGLIRSGVMVVVKYPDGTKTVGIRWIDPDVWKTAWTRRVFMLLCESQEVDSGSTESIHIAKWAREMSANPDYIRMSPWAAVEVELYGAE